MRNLTISVFLVTSVWAQQGNQGQNPHGARQAYYDTFDGPWLDPAKWMVDILDCGPTGLDCVREIQKGRLRVMTRILGDRGADVGTQGSSPMLKFAHPESINSMTTDVTLDRFSAVSCASNTTDTSRSVVKVASGTFFNSGSGNASNDVNDDVVLIVDTTNPKMVSVLNWMTSGTWGLGTEIGSYPIGTTLTVTNTWDKAHHQFVSVVTAKGDANQSRKVVVPYSSYFGDSEIPPVVPWKYMQAYLWAANCTTAQTSAAVEVFYDNVLINTPPPKE